MKKNIICILALSAILFGVSGCSKPADETTAATTQEESTTEETTEEETTTKEEPTAEASAKKAAGDKPDFGPLSDDIYSFQIQIDEDVYQFPMTYDEFVSYGWVYKDDETAMLDAGFRSAVEVFNMGKLQCYAGIVNFDINAKPFSECYIVSITIDSSMVKDTDSVVTLPKGITLGGSMEDAVAAYGTPSNDRSSDSGSRYLTYSLASYQEVDLTSIYDDAAIIGKIEVENIKKPDDFVESAMSEDIPEIVGKYQAPPAISDDFAEYTVDFGGNLYQLPAPVSVFLENGWSIIEDGTEPTVSGRDSGWVTLIKDNQQIRTLARNYSENATVIQNCFMTDLKTGGHDNKTAMTISKGITLGMSPADLEAALADVDYEKDEESSYYINYTIYPVGTRTDQVSIAVSKESGVVAQIEIQYNPKFSDYTNR